MSAFEIVLLVIVIFCIVFLFVYLLFMEKRKKSSSSQNQAKTEYQERVEHQELLKNKLANIEKELTNMQNIKNDINNINYKQDSSRQQSELLRNKLEELKNQLNLSQDREEKMSDKIENFNQIFLSNYRRGKIGEFSLEFILSNLLGRNQDMLYKQYTMKNNNRPDIFLKFPNCNIPIDSKFPYDNFVKIVQEDSKSNVYKTVLKDLKNNIEMHIKDVAKKYISLPDNTQQVIMYLPSQALFEFIYSGEETFEKTLILANDSKVVIAGPNTLPVVIRIIISFVDKQHQKENIEKILKDLAFFAKEFDRFTERWNKFEKRVEGLQKDTNDLSITQNKIKKKFHQITESKKAPTLESGKN